MERKVERVGVKILSLPQRKRVAAYARVSSGKDAMLHSLSAQISYYSKVIQSNPDWEYCGVYADEAKTGTKDTREDFQRLVADCRSGKIDIVLTKSISRFARNTVTLLETVRELKSVNVDVYFEEQNIHSMSADGELMLTILASYAQEESRSSSENQKWRIRKSFEQGEIMNLRNMFGFKINKNGITHDEHNAEIVREIFDRIIDGESYTAIAKDLNGRGIMCELGGEWNAHRISSLITNEKYVGDALLQKKFRNNHLEKKLLYNKGELPQYYATDTHEGIVDRETFDKVQAISKQRREKYTGDLKQHLSVFTGLIGCPKCGKNYRRITSNGSHGWNCSTYIKKGKAVCHGKKIPENVLYEITAEVLNLKKFDPLAVADKIEKIIVSQSNHLTYIFRDGSNIEKEWHDHSRRDSWTPEMKEKARRQTLERNRR